MISKLAVVITFVASLHGMEVIPSAKTQWVPLQLQDVRICISQELFKHVETTGKIIKLAGEDSFLGITVHEWKLVEPFFALEVEYAHKPCVEGLCEKKMRRLCTSKKGKQLKELKETAEKLSYEKLLHYIVQAENCLHMLSRPCINDNDTIRLLTGDYKKVNVCWRLAKLSRTIEMLVKDAAEIDAQIPLKNINQETWRLIRQSLAFLYKLKKSKRAFSAQTTLQKIDTLIGSLNQSELLQFFTAVNYLEIPELYERARNTLRRTKIADPSDQLLLDLPSQERNLLIRALLFETLGAVEGVMLEKLPHTVNKVQALSIAVLDDTRVMGAFAGEDELLMVDLLKGTELRYPLFMFDRPYLIHINEEGSLISAHGNSIYRIWDLKSQAPIRVYGEEGFWEMGLQVNDLCMGKNKRLYTCHLDGAVRIWHEETGKECMKLCAHEQDFRRNILTLSLINDGQEDAKIVAGSVSGAVLIWDMQSGAFLHYCDDQEKNAEPIYALCTSDDGRIFAGSFDGTVRVWSSNDGALLSRFELPSSISCLSAPLNTILICGLGHGAIHVIDSNTGYTLMICTGHTSWVKALALLKSEKLFSAAPSPDGFVRAWDMRLLNSLMNMNREQAKAILQLMREKNPANENQKSMLWTTIKKILNCEEIAPAASSCKIQ